MTCGARAIWTERRHAACPPRPAARRTDRAGTVGFALLLALTASPTALRADEPPGRPVVPAAAPPELDAEAVTVEAVPVLRLADAYRTSPYVAFVTPDAALAAYGILRRDLEDSLARRRDAQLEHALRMVDLTNRLLSSVQGLGRTGSKGADPPQGAPPPAPSKAEIRLASLRAMYRVGSTDARLAAGVAQVVARLRGQLPSTGGDAAGLEVDSARDPDPEASAMEAWEADPSGRAARWRVTSGGLLPDFPLVGYALEEPSDGDPIQRALSHLISQSALHSSLGPIADARRSDDLWFGTPVERLIPVWPPPAETSKVLALASMARVLAALLTPPHAAPSIVHGATYRTLLEDAAYGGDVLARAGPIQCRPGPASAPTGTPVTATGRCLVHPDPSFWRGLARACQALADEAPRHGLTDPPSGDPSLPPPRPPHSTIGSLTRLARFCERFAARAELQLTGGALPAHDEMRARWAAFLEEVGGGGGADPLVVSVRTAGSGDRRVRHGLSGLAKLRLRYPHRGEALACEGAVFVVGAPPSATEYDGPDAASKHTSTPHPAK